MPYCIHVFHIICWWLVCSSIFSSWYCVMFLGIRCERRAAALPFQFTPSSCRNEVFTLVPTCREQQDGNEKDVFIRFYIQMFPNVACELEGYYHLNDVQFNFSLLKHRWTYTYCNNHGWTYAYEYIQNRIAIEFQLFSIQRSSHHSFHYISIHTD